MIIIPTGVCKGICAACIWIHQRAVRTWQPHELCTVYPASASWRYAVILYILSAENKQTLSNPLKLSSFENPKLQFPVRGWSGGPQTPLDPRGIYGRVRMMWGGQGRPLLRLQVKTDSGPVKPTLGQERRRCQPGEFGYKYPPRAAVSSKSKHFRFYLVIYLPRGGKNQGRGNVELKDCSVYSCFYFPCFILFLHVAY